MAGNHTDREEGVEFTDIQPVLERVSYPVTKDEFVSTFGDHRIGRTNAESIAIEDLFDRTGKDQFDSPTEIRQSILNLMPRESVGRQRYSDRGGATPRGPDRTSEFTESL